MGPVDFIVLAVIVAILALSGWYVYRSKKKGKKCIGCPDGCCSTQNTCPGCNGCREK